MDPGYENDFKYLNDEKKYKVYKNGLIYSIKSEKILKPIYSKTNNIN